MIALALVVAAGILFALAALVGWLAPLARVTRAVRRGVTLSSWILSIVGAVLNDIGPALEPEGLARIGGYVGQGRSFPTWMHAARAIEESQGVAYPGYRVDDWLAMAKRLMVLSSNGRIVFDYDMKIAEPLQRQGAEGQADLWPMLEGLAGKPVLLLRGSLSDLLSAATLERMRAVLPGAEAVTLPNVGHAPTLDEPEAIAAIERLLARCLD